MRSSEWTHECNVCGTFVSQRCYSETEKFQFLMQEAGSRCRCRKASVLQILIVIVLMATFLRSICHGQPSCCTAIKQTKQTDVNYNCTYAVIAYVHGTENTTGKCIDCVSDRHIAYSDPPLPTVLSYRLFRLSTIPCRAFSGWHHLELECTAWQCHFSITFDSFRHQLKIYFFFVDLFLACPLGGPWLLRPLIIIIIIKIILNVYSAIMPLGGYRGAGGTGR